MRTITTYIANTGFPIQDTITEANDDGVKVRMQLAGLVQQVRLQAQDEDTATLVVDHVAQPVETADPATWGDVQYQPQAGDVAAAHRYVAWWRLVLLDGSVIDSPEFIWNVAQHGVAPEAVVTPTGVCQAWATNEDVARHTPGSLDVDYESWLVEASELLYILSARQYPGLCSQTVRPMNAQCGCFQVLSRGHIVEPPDWQWGPGYWFAESWNSGYGCGMVPAVRLAGHVRSITNVRISGSVIDPATYRVDQNEYLVRLTDPATGENPGWPACQNIALPDDAPGTFSVTYTWGATPPIAGVRAAAQLAYQLYLNDNPQARQKCTLPAGWTSISRQGITITRPQIQRLATEGTGIVGIDAFLASANPGGLDRVPAVYSRDVQPYAQRLG